MKTKDAFAFRNFDEKKILARRFFKDFRLPDGDDETALGVFDAEEFLDASDAERKLEQLHKLSDRMSRLHKLIVRHVKRLRKFWQATSDERAAKLLREYSWYGEAVTLCWLKLRSYFINGEDKLNEPYRKEFGARLKAARRAAGLTQKDLAEVLGITPTGYSKYEQGRADMPTSALVKTVKILRCSADKLLGLAD